MNVTICCFVIMMKAYEKGWDVEILLCVIYGNLLYYLTLANTILMITLRASPDSKICNYFSPWSNATGNQKVIIFIMLSQFK